MTVWVERIIDRVLGVCYVISSEMHDGIVYQARTVKEAVKKYETNIGVKVTKVIEM